MVFFLVGIHRILWVGLLLVVQIDVSELEEAKVGVLAVGIVGDAFQSAIEQGHAHDTKV